MKLKSRAGEKYLKRKLTKEVSMNNSSQSKRLGKEILLQSI